MNSERTIEGRWLVGEPGAQPIYGILKFSLENGITLETKAVRSVAIETVFRQAEGVSLPVFPVIHGFDENNNPVTLFYCSTVRINNSTGLDTRSYHVHCGVVGRHFDSLDDFAFDGIRFRVNFLHPWKGYANFKAIAPHQEGFIWGFEPNFTKVFSLDEESTVQICDTRQSNRSVGKASVAEFNSNTYVETLWKTPHKWSAILQWTNRFRRLITLASGSPCHLLSIEGIRNDTMLSIGTDKTHKSMDVLISAPDISKEEENEAHIRFLFSYSDVQEDFAGFLKSWFDYSDKLSSVLDLYFAVVFNKHLYMNHKFLFLVQALERYHAVQLGGLRENPDDYKARFQRVRSAMSNEDYQFYEAKLNWGNEKTLLQRINELLQVRSLLLADLVEDSPKFAQIVKDTRNYYTHFDEKLRQQGKVLEGKQLLEMAHRLKGILEVLFLDDLKVGGDAVLRAKGRAKDYRVVEYK